MENKQGLVDFICGLETFRGRLFSFSFIFFGKSENLMNENFFCPFFLNLIQSNVNGFVLAMELKIILNINSCL